MLPSTSLAAVAVASLVRGGARKPPPPPPPPDDIYDKFMSTFNEPLRFFISGNIGNVIFFYIERLTFYLLNTSKHLSPVIKEYMDSVSFFIAYLLQVLPQHWLHAFLVYGMDTIDTRQKYWTTLFGCYSAYTSSLIGSTFLNMFFVKSLKLDKTVSFVLTLWTFAVINYFVITWIVNSQSSSNENQPKAVLDARKAAQTAQRAISEMKKKEQHKAKLVEAKMKERAQQAQLKAKALEEKMKAKAALDKQKEKEKLLKEKERAKAKAEQTKADAKRKGKTKVKEVGNKAAVRTRGGGSGTSSFACPIRFHTTIGSKEKLHSFVLSVGKGVDIMDE